MVDGLERVVQHRRYPRITGRLRLVFVAHKLGLQGHADEVVDCFDHVLDGRDAALGQRHQPGRHYFHLLVRR